MADTELIARSLYTRQELANLTGLDDSALNYWMREGLLLPAEGGGGKGRHRRFDFVQVNIAAIFRELRRFGLNIAAFRSLAELLQGAALIGSGRKLHPSNYPTAAYLASSLARFRAGKIVMIRAHGYDEEPPEGISRRALTDWHMEKRPAQTEAEIVSAQIGLRNDYDAHDAILAVAETLGPGREVEARIYADLVYSILSPGYSSGETWLLGLRENGTWKVEHGNDGKFFDTLNAEKPDDFGAAIFLPISGIFRDIWKLKTWEELRKEERARLIQNQLATAGILATVTPVADQVDSFTIDADRRVSYADIGAVVGEVGFRLLHQEEDE